MVQNDKIFLFKIIFLQTFHGVLLNVQGVELASTIDHVILTEMNAVTWLAGLDLLQVKPGPQCVQIIN